MVASSGTIEGHLIMARTVTLNCDSCGNTVPALWERRAVIIDSDEMAGGTYTAELCAQCDAAFRSAFDGFSRQAPRDRTSTIGSFAGPAIRKWGAAQIENGVVFSDTSGVVITRERMQGRGKLFVSVTDAYARAHPQSEGKVDVESAAPSQSEPSEGRVDEAPVVQAPSRKR